MKRDSRATKQQASGQWLEILADLCPSLIPALNKPGAHVPCPVLDGTDGFRVFKDVKHTGGGVSNQEGVFTDGFQLLMWANGWSFPKAHDEIYEWLNGSGSSTASKKMQDVKPAGNKSEKAQKKRYILNKLWAEAVDTTAVEARPAMEYLAKRRCFPLPWEMPDLVYHSSLQYREEGGTRNYGGLLALMRDKNGKAATLHRTFLSDDGRKAPVKEPKRVMPVPDDAVITGGAIRLQPRNWQGEVIGIAEGIETALCISCATQTVCWAAMTASMLAKFEPPEWVKHVIIWADYDVKKLVRRNGILVESGEAGQNAAKELQERLAKLGIGSTIKIPPALPGEKGRSVDWADVYSIYGSKPFFSNNAKSWAI